MLHLTMTSKAPLEGEELQAHWEAQGEAGPGGEGAQTQEAAGADPMDEDAGAGAAKGGEGVSDAEGVEGCDGELLGGTPGAPEQARQQPSLSVAAKADADGGGAAPGDVREAAGLESDGGREQPGTSEPAKPGERSHSGMEWDYAEMDLNPKPQIRPSGSHRRGSWLLLVSAESLGGCRVCSLGRWKRPGTQDSGLLPRLPTYPVFPGEQNGTVQ